MNKQNNSVLNTYRSSVGKGYTLFKNLNCNYHNLRVYKTWIVAKFYAIVHGGEVSKVTFKPLNSDNIVGSYTWVCDRIFPENGTAAIAKCAAKKIDFDNKDITNRFTKSGLLVCFDSEFVKHVDELFEVVFV